MIEQSKDCLFLAALMAVESPGKKCLPVVQQSEIGPHAHDALGPAIPPTAGNEFIEPNRRCEISLGEKRAGDCVERLAGIEPFGAIGDITLVRLVIVKSLAPARIPEIRRGGKIRHVLFANVIELLDGADGFVGPEAPQI